MKEEEDSFSESNRAMVTKGEENEGKKKPWSGSKEERKKEKERRRRRKRKKEEGENVVGDVTMHWRRGPLRQLIYWIATESRIMNFENS